MDETPNLNLPYILASQAQKHVTHNEALRALDAVVQLAVLDRNLTAPPPSPADGDRHIVAAGATEDWADRTGSIAAYQDGVWTFYLPRPGFVAWVAAEATLACWTGSAWADLSSTITALQNLALVGIGTTADGGNPFSAKLNAALWTAKYAAEGGSGDLRYAMNKEESGNTVSLLMQDNWSGRAEIGLSGDDDLHIKVSPDGTSWIDAMKIAPTDGTISFPASGTGLRRRLTALRTYYVDAALGSDSNDGLAGGSGHAFATPQHALDVVFGTLDLGGQNVTIQLADGTYGGVAQTAPQVGAGTVTIQGNGTHPENVVIAASGSGISGGSAANGATLTLSGFEVSSAAASCLSASARATIYFSNLRIGSAPLGQVRASDGASIVGSGNYSIVGGTSSQAHWVATGNGIIRVQNRGIAILASATFTSGFAWAATGAIIFGNGCSFTGTATGKRYQGDSNGVVNISTTTLPGDTAGATSTGGQVS